MTQKERTCKRNTKLKRFFASLQKKHPKWRWSALINDTAEQFNIAPHTVTSILKSRGYYSITDLE